MGELAKLQNIGAVVEEQLNEVGITTYEQLKEIGSKQAWLRIKAIDDSACINRLYALEGAIQRIPKTDLSIEIKAELKEFYNTFKG
ncbi:MAG: TfoX/Sxy family protein [Mobilitalea sp.]